MVMPRKSCNSCQNSSGNHISQNPSVYNYLSYLRYEFFIDKGCGWFILVYILKNCPNFYFWFWIDFNMFSVASEFTNVLLVCETIAPFWHDHSLAMGPISKLSVCVSGIFCFILHYINYKFFNFVISIDLRTPFLYILCLGSLLCS